MTIEEEHQLIIVSAKNGLNRAEVEALVGHTLDDEGLSAFNRAKGLAKLDRNKKKNAPKESGQKAGIVPKMKPVLPPVYNRMTKKEFMSVIEYNVGIITAICNQLDCTFTQFWAAVKKWDLQEFVKEQKSNLVSLAEHVLMDCLNSSDEKIRFQASQYVLKTVGSKDGWREQPSNVLATQIDVGKDVSIRQIFGIEEE